MTGELVTSDSELESLLDSMTVLQRRFVEEMMVSPSYAEAYRRAGGDAVTQGGIHLSAWRMATNDKVCRALAIMRAKRNVRVRIEHDWVLTKLLDVIERCVQDKPVFGPDGEPTGEYQFDSRGATKALELLMKHLGMFEKDNRQKSGSQEQYEAAMSRLRARGVDPDKLKALPGGEGGGN